MPSTDSRILDDAAFDSQQIIADLERELAECKAERDEAIASGITINGLPVVTGGNWHSNSRQPISSATLPDYYREHVIGGPGAFMVPVRDRDQFAQANKTKIIREIADLGPDAGAEARLMPVQAEARMNCMAGEARNWDMMRN